jgi:cell fate (sporulation/competence/biofilm development) regulator YlbF (YheA/YmcA/DUF963 family)
MPNASAELGSAMRDTPTYGEWLRQVRRLCAEDEEFRLLWDDAVAARRAYRHFRAFGAPGTERADEYRQISKELVVDIRRYLDLKRPQMHTPKGILSFKKKALS